MAPEKRKYDAAFKQEALHLLEFSGKSIRQIETDLGSTPGLPNKWKQRYRLHPETGAVKPSEERELEAENRRLHRELQLVKAEDVRCSMPSSRQNGAACPCNARVVCCGYRSAGTSLRAAA